MRNKKSKQKQIIITMKYQAKTIPCKSNEKIIRKQMSRRYITLIKNYDFLTNFQLTEKNYPQSKASISCSITISRLSIELRCSGIFQRFIFILTDSLYVFMCV